MLLCLEQTQNTFEKNLQVETREWQIQGRGIFINSFSSKKSVIECNLISYYFKEKERKLKRLKRVLFSIDCERYIFIRKKKSKLIKNLLDF